MLPWPPYSPDLSPIEHVWDIIGRRLHALPQPRSEDELWQMVEREWRAIPQDAIRTLIDSLPRRVAACIAVRAVTIQVAKEHHRKSDIISMVLRHRHQGCRHLKNRRLPNIGKYIGESRKLKLPRHGLEVVSIFKKPLAKNQGTNCKLSLLPGGAQEIETPVARVRTDIKDTVKLYHDNATSHTAFIITNFLARSNTPVIPHPPYSLDLAPCDFFLFPRLKREMKGKHWETVENIQHQVTTFLRSIPVEEFQGAFQAWQTRLCKCIDAGGMYFEEN
ncbi:hypothetical protein LAZ67_2006599 [Cordylochernes scorpioides]|uniref:Transposase n=1 Tax=Cordylochernes scorpioides TaxID=51811 RepID=A0ABY6K5N4_9ARAC|nr:hypothetical protein LAZ67_2006599 [Cordylochernes scorpioides]